MPAEHGGWGLTLEPGILGVLLAPSLAGLLLAVAALLAFLLRTPARLVLRQLRASGRTTSEAGQARMQLASQVATVELLGIGLALAGTAILALDPNWIWPLAVALPMFAIAFLFDLRSASRHIIPEIVGSVAVAAVAAMGTLAGGGSGVLALGAWLILSARVFSSIPHVRAQISRIHGRDVPPGPGVVGDLAAVGTAAVAALLDPSLALGGATIIGLVLIQRITLARPPRPAKVLGVRQMALGFAVVGLTTVGVWIFG